MKRIDWRQRDAMAQDAGLVIAHRRVLRAHLGPIGAVVEESLVDKGGKRYLYRISNGGASFYELEDGENEWGEDSPPLRDEPLVIDAASRSASATSAEGGAVFPAFGMRGTR